MASVTKLRTISSVNDTRIQLNNSSFARKWSSTLGTSWTKIRVWARISVTDSGADLTSTPRFAIGIQSGDTTRFLDAGGPTNWCGMITNVATISRTAGPPVLYGAGSLYYAAKKVGTTLTLASTLNGNTIRLGYDATTANRICVAVEITKGSPNYNFISLSQTGTAADLSLATLEAQIVLATPSIAQHIYNSGGSINLAVSEAAGTFDAVGFAWNHSDSLVELSEHGVVKLA
jgi:hypothetical protein